METTSDIVIGQIVKSKAGRDKGRIFLVTNVLDDKFVEIVDGDLRKIDSPKKKKIRHLIVYNSIVKDYKAKIENGDKINNAYIRKILGVYNKEI